MPVSRLWLISLLVLAATLHGDEVPTEARLKADTDAFIARMESGWMKTYGEGMAALAEDVIKVCGCNAISAQAVKAAARQCAKRYSDIRREMNVEHYRAHWGIRDEEGFWDDYAPLIIGRKRLDALDKANAEWETALHAILTAEQWLTWQKDMVVRRDRCFRALPEAVEAEIDRRAESLHSIYGDRLKDATEDWKPSDERMEVLQAAVEAGVKAQRAVLANEINRSMSTVHYLIHNLSEETLKKLEAHTWNPYSIYQNHTASEAGRKAFNEALKKLITPEEQLAITNAEKEATKKVDNVIKDTVDRIAMQRDDRAKRVLVSRVRTLSQVLSLDDARSKRFSDALEKRIQDTRNQWRQKITEKVRKNILANAKSSSLARVLKQAERGMWGYYDEDAERDEFLARRESWRATVETELTPEEQQRWAKSEEETLKSRTELITMLGTTSLDQQLLLQPEQRSIIEKLLREPAERLAKVGDEFMNEENMSSLSFFQVLAEAVGESKLKPLLDDDQRTALKSLLEGQRGVWESMQKMIDKLP